MILIDSKGKTMKQFLVCRSKRGSGFELKKKTVDIEKFAITPIPVFELFLPLMPLTI